MDTATRDKWDRAAKTFDWMAGFGPERRWEPVKKSLFANMRRDADILFIALGTGLDIAHFPPGRHITAIDISPAMIAKAAPRVAAYEGRIDAVVADVHDMQFADARFDQVFTSCTFCSVPEPVEGLRAVRRVMRPGGELFMFEHTGSRLFPFNLLMNVMTPVSRLAGPEMNRNTTANVRQAGFDVLAVHNVFLDVVKTIYAVNPQ